MLLEEAHVSTVDQSLGARVVNPVAISPSRRSQVDSFLGADAELVFGLIVFDEDATAESAKLGDVWFAAIVEFIGGDIVIGFGRSAVGDDCCESAALGPELGGKAGTDEHDSSGAHNGPDGAFCNAVVFWSVRG